MRFHHKFWWELSYFHVNFKWKLARDCDKQIRTEWKLKNFWMREKLLSSFPLRFWSLSVWVFQSMRRKGKLFASVSFEHVSVSLDAFFMLNSHSTKRQLFISSHHYGNCFLCFWISSVNRCLAQWTRNRNWINRKRHNLQLFGSETNVHEIAFWFYGLEAFLKAFETQIIVKTSTLHEFFFRVGLMLKSKREWICGIYQASKKIVSCF